jgi:mannose/fructose/N-acetylgalactosamine-specific phosphotransferase system component IIC
MKLATLMLLKVFFMLCNVSFSIQVPGDVVLGTSDGLPMRTVAGVSVVDTPLSVPITVLSQFISELIFVRLVYKQQRNWRDFTMVTTHTNT